MQGFREKNRDLMRQDIVDVLKTSHMDLVRALIGQPPYAVYCWRMACVKLKAIFAFRFGESLVCQRVSVCVCVCKCECVCVCECVHACTDYHHLQHVHVCVFALCFVGREARITL